MWMKGLGGEQPPELKTAAIQQRSIAVCIY